MTAIGMKPERRVRAVRECVEFLKQAATPADRPFSYEGELYTIKNYHPQWVKSQPPLVYVGSNGPQSARMATRVADGILMSDFTRPMVRKMKEIVDQGCVANGRSPSGFRINNFFALHVKQDKQEAIAEARKNLYLRGVLERSYLETFMGPEACDFVEAHKMNFVTAFRRQTPIIEGVPEEIIDTLVDNLTLTGDYSDLDRVIKEIKSFEQAGLTEIALGLHEDPAEAIKLIGAHIIPALQ